MGQDDLTKPQKEKGFFHHLKEMTTLEIQPEQGKLGDILAQRRTDLAVTRTMLAAGRNLMAWVRTSVSLISFGFTLYKFLFSLYEKGLTRRLQASGPRNLGLFLIGLGTFPLVLILIEFWKYMRQIGKSPSFILRVPSFLVACMILALGLVLFFSIITRLELF